MTAGHDLRLGPFPFIATRFPCAYLRDTISANAQRWLVQYFAGYRDAQLGIIVP